MTSTTLKYIHFLFLLAISFNCVAGASNAELKCNSIKNKVTLEGDIPGDYADFNLTLKNNKTIIMGNEDDRIEVVTNLSQHIFIASVMLSNKDYFLLYAVPNSIKYRGGSSRLFSANFKAVLNTSSEQIGMQCTLNHSI